MDPDGETLPQPALAKGRSKVPPKYKKAQKRKILL
jgi:hypothetical protein